jgi:hypothetical protein
MKHFATLFFLCGSLIAADTSPPAIRQFDVSTLERLGNEMFAQDIRAARATDLALAQNIQFPDSPSRGWIISNDGSKQIVRFFAELGGVLSSTVDITFTGRKDGKITTHTPFPLAGSELAQARARLLVAKDVSALANRCTESYNLISLPDPDGSGFLIWAIAANMNADEVQVGGHFRYTVSADGGTIEQRDQLFRSCLALPKRPPNAPKDTKIAALTMSWLVSDTPLEIHVFLQRYARLPFAMVTASNGKMWSVENGHIQPLNFR